MRGDDTEEIHIPYDEARDASEEKTRKKKKKKKKHNLVLPLIQCKCYSLSAIFF